MSSVYSKTLYQKRFMIGGWFVGTAAIVAFTMAFFNSFSNGAIGISLQSMPPALQKLVGDSASFTTINGYIAQQLFSLRVPLLMVILAIAVCISVSATEEQQGVTETQLTLPISRTQLLVQKLMAAVTVLAVASVGIVAGILIGLVLARQHYNIVHVVPHLLGVLLVSLDYGLVGFAASSVTGRRGLSLGLASGLAFGGYLIDTMATSVSSLASVDKVTLFHYYNASIDNSYHWGDLALLTGVALVLVGVSIAAFNKRDIRAR